MRNECGLHSDAFQFVLILLSLLLTEFTEYYKRLSLAFQAIQITKLRPTCGFMQKCRMRHHQLKTFNASSGLDHKDGLPHFRNPFFRTIKNHVATNYSANT